MSRTPFHDESWASIVRLDAASSEPLFRQLARALAKSIRNGRPAPGNRMPSTRTLAAELAISRMTVLSAMNQLRSEGLIRPMRGSGTYVTDTASQADPGARSARLDPKTESDRLTARTAERASKRHPFAMAGCRPKDFPFPAWAKAEKAGLKTLRSGKGYGDELLEILAQYLEETRGLRCNPDQIILTSSMRHSLATACQWLLERGEVAWVEDPCAPGTRHVLESMGAQVESAPMDELGFDVFRAKNLSPAAKVAVVSPRRTFPTGIRMSPARRTALLAWADSTHGWILEDDFDAEFNRSGESYSPLAAGNRAGNVVYMSGFDRLLAPVGRLSYLVLPSESLDGMAPWAAGNERMPAGGTPAPHFKSTLAAFMQSGRFSHHASALRATYSERREVFLSALAAHDTDLIVNVGASGEHVLASLPRDTSDVVVATLLGRQGINVRPFSDFGVLPNTSPGLLFGYTGYEPAELKRAVTALAARLPDAIEAASGS